MKFRTGFTLIEVLIALIVMAIGSLGLGQLHIISLKNNQSSFKRSQANLLANDMIDRMRLNSTVPSMYLGSIGAVESGVDELMCTQCQDASNPCLPAQLVLLDHCVWQARLSVLRSNAIAVVSKNNTVYTVNISWDDPVTRAQIMFLFIL